MKVHEEEKAAAEAKAAEEKAAAEKEAAEKAVAQNQRRPTLMIFASGIVGKPRRGEHRRQKKRKIPARFRTWGGERKAPDYAKMNKKIK